MLTKPRSTIRPPAMSPSASAHFFAFGHFALMSQKIQAGRMRVASHLASMRTPIQKAGRKSFHPKSPVRNSIKKAMRMRERMTRKAEKKTIGFRKKPQAVGDLRSMEEPGGKKRSKRREPAAVCRLSGVP